MQLPRITIIFVILLLQSITPAYATGSSMLDDDVEVMLHIRKSFEQMAAYMQQRPDLFLTEQVNEKRLTSREQREEIWLFWQRFLDRIFVLDMLGKKYDALFKESDGEKQKEMFRITYAAFLLQYRYAIDFISRLENDPSMHTMLNEPVPELGLDEDIYKQLKFRFLNVLRAVEFTRLNAAYAFYGKGKQLNLVTGIESDNTALWHMGVGEGTVETFKNGWQIIQDTGLTAWFPLQASVSEWMGDVKILRPNHSLISVEQISQIKNLLLPGDILLERREWYLSNIGLPGYWPHAALYIGTAEQRADYFNDPAVKQHYASEGGFETLLKNTYPQAYSTSEIRDDYGHVPRVIEAISEGVSFTTLEHSVDADSVAILRPSLSKLDKAHAIKRAFHFSGRPYDFDFDFLTDSELVCTELVYKAYEPAKGFTGLRFPTQKVIGRTVTTANDMAKMVDDEYLSEHAQLELIAFYDGHERSDSAIKSDAEAFRNSWKRPKMFIWVQGTSLEPSYKTP